MWPSIRRGYPVFFSIIKIGYVYYVISTIVITYSFHWPIVDDRPSQVSHPEITFFFFSFRYNTNEKDDWVPTITLDRKIHCLVNGSALNSNQSGFWLYRRFYLVHWFYPKIQVNLKKNVNCFLKNSNFSAQFRKKEEVEPHEFCLLPFFNFRLLNSWTRSAAGDVTGRPFIHTTHTRTHEISKSRILFLFIFKRKKRKLCEWK
jgi:hypothetical protein